MKRIFYLSALGAILFASCAKTENPNPNQEKTYSFSIGAEKETDNTDETRVEFVDGLMHWSVGDKVGMFVSRPNGMFINNIAMTGQHTEPTTSTSFIGELTESQIVMFDANGGYGYITYFPYDVNVTGQYDLGFGADISFAVPQTITIPKNEFPSDNVFMYSYNNLPALTWLDDNGEQQYSERVGFNYKHVYSYLRVKLDVNLMGLPVTKIEVTHPSANISGNMTMLLRSTSSIRSVYGGSNRNMVVNINGGMSVGDEVYIPMILESYPSGTKFTFTFSNGVTYEKTIPSNLTLQRGKIHNIAFKLPFIADFMNSNNYTPSLPSLNTVINGPFDFAGHTYLGGGIQTGKWASTANIIQFGNGNSDSQTALATPALNLSGKTSIPVEVTMTVAFTHGDWNAYVGPVSLYVNTAPTNATNYTFSSSGVNLSSQVGFSGSYVERATPTTNPLVINCANSKIGISFRGYSSRIYYSYMYMSRLTIMPL